MKKLNKRGISLIVLVITIIVMIILATAIILSLNKSDIVEKAKEAVNASDLANAKQIITLARAEYELEGISGDFETYAESKLKEAGYKTQGDGGIKVSENGTISTIYVGSDNRQALIPAGFTVSKASKEDTVTEGLVIYEGTEPVTNKNVEAAQLTRNQFVWIPVDDIDEFKCKTQTGFGELAEPLTATTPYITDISLYADEIAQYNEMKASVEKHGGFYIARYEAGLPNGVAAGSANYGNKAGVGLTIPVSVKGATPWSNIPFDSVYESEYNLGWIVKKSIPYGDDSNPGCAFISQKMCSNISSVKCHLIYSVNWDAALDFIAETDSTYPTKGNSLENNTLQPDYGIKETGFFSICNICDMGGNVSEWSYATTNFDSGGQRFSRGDQYISTGSSPMTHNPNQPGDTVFGGEIGFRVSLYIK